MKVFKKLKMSDVEDIYLWLSLLMIIMIIMFMLPTDPKKIQEQVDRDIKPYMEIRNHIDSLQKENDSLKLIIKNYEDTTRVCK